MKEKLGVALAATSVLVAGCATESAHPPKKVTIESAGTFPNALPSAVSQQLGNLVAIKSVRLLQKKPDQGMSCTGVRIDQSAFLTTGSCDYDQLAVDHLAYCDATAISMSIPPAKPEDQPKGVTLRIDKKNGVAPAVNTTDMTKMTQDWLVGEIADKPEVSVPAYSNPTHFAPAAVQIPVGTQLFTASYEKNADGSKVRNPDPEFAKFTPDDIKAGLTKPAIMGAIALDQSPNGMLRVLTVKPYGDPNENQLRGGDSGSPVWDAKGDLIGIIENANSPRKISEYKKALNIDLPGLPDDADASLAVVQLVNPPQINKLQAHQIPAATC